MNTIYKSYRAAHPPRRKTARLPARFGKTAKRKRLDNKAKRGQLKASRSKIEYD